jgi:hypothetical protein
LIVKVRKIAAGAGIVCALSATGLGIASGIASADEATPNAPATTWKLDRPHWDKWDGEGRDWDGWRGDPYWNGPRYGGPCVWVPPAVSVWVPPAVC